MELAELTRRVQDGTALLDEIKPNWANEINLPTLDLRNGSQCVLGQTYGTYDEGLAALAEEADLDADAAEAYGFYLEEPDEDIPAASIYSSNARIPAYEALTMLWSGAIAARRSQ